MMITAVAMTRKDRFPDHQPPKPLHFWALTYIAVLGTVFKLVCSLYTAVV